MKQVTFYFVRHGETLYNQQHRVQGFCDSPLTGNGIRQAGIAAERLKLVPFDRAYTSVSGRAYDTARIILKDRYVPLRRMEGLKEINFGWLDGQLIAVYKEQLAHCRQIDSYREYGGDDTASISQRIRETFQTINAECRDGDRVLVVSHGSYYMHLLPALLNMDMKAFIAEHSRQNQLPVPNASISVFTCTDGLYEMKLLPDDSRNPL